MQKRLRKISQADLWVASDIEMFENVVRLWQTGHQVFLYKVDAPSKVVCNSNILHRNRYRHGEKRWLWWVRIYLRERYMTRNVRWILNNYNLVDHPTVLVFLQSFHWEHVKFLLSRPPKKRVWHYYFGQYSHIKPQTISRMIHNESPILYRYWRKMAYLEQPQR